EAGIAGRGQLITLPFEDDFARPLAEMRFFKMLALPDDVRTACRPALDRINVSAPLVVEDGVARHVPPRRARVGDKTDPGQRASASPAEKTAARPAAGGQAAAKPSRGQVILAYRLFLNRRPSEGELERMMQN